MSIPAFGFKSTDKYVEEVNQTIALHQNMGAIISMANGRHFSSADADAMMSARRTIAPHVRKTALQIAKTDKVSKLLGYIPVVGTAMGVRRFVKFHDDDSKGLHMTRGAIEFLSIGAILIPIDIIASIHLAKK